jgi:hypothetical protein
MFRGPGQANLDFSVFKNFPIHEKKKIEFRTEFFNILNHANFGPPAPFFLGSQAQIFDSTGKLTGGGGLQNLVTQPRDIQFALKVIW